MASTATTIKRIKATSSIKPILFIMFESSSGSIASQPLIVPVIYLVGINSISAIDFNYWSTVRALSGIFICQRGMKTKN